MYPQKPMQIKVHTQIHISQNTWFSILPSHKNKMCFPEMFRTLIYCPYSKKSVKTKWSPALLNSLAGSIYLPKIYHFLPTNLTSLIWCKCSWNNYVFSLDYLEHHIYSFHIASSCWRCMTWSLFKAMASWSDSVLMKPNEKKDT